MMTMKIITEEEIRNSPKTHVYIFGDNLEHQGLGGQAKVARPFVKFGKAFGIPTKRKPNDDVSSFFSDKHDEIIAVKEAIDEIKNMKKYGKKIVFFPNIGEGLADLPHKSPKIYRTIKNFVKDMEKLIM